MIDVVLLFAILASILFTCVGHYRRRPKKSSSREDILKEVEKEAVESEKHLQEVAKKYKVTPEKLREAVAAAKRARKKERKHE